jgi:hypothetical protein
MPQRLVREQERGTREQQGRDEERDSGP